MKIYRLSDEILIEKDAIFYLAKNKNWDRFINREDLNRVVTRELPEYSKVVNPEKLMAETIKPPIGSQEVWASGVTYFKSREARMEESEEAGGGSFYDRVYEAARPELFFKATPERVVGPGQPINIRKDAFWNVPEPELTLFLTSNGTITGYTIGNDMSARDIEGENPLYLPQAKTFEKCAGLGPCIYVPEAPLPPESKIKLKISREDHTMFEESITINQIKRSFENLVEYLFRELSFQHGCFLMTGTGIIPPNSFSLQRGDKIEIFVDHIGTLINEVA